MTGAMKHCGGCERDLPVEDFNRNRSRADGRQTQCRSCHAEATARAREKNPPTPVKLAAAARKYRGRLTDQVLAAYGGVCACCGEDEAMFLTLDHVDGRGAEEMETGYRLYMRAKREGFPTKYRLLCWNCNCGRARNGGVCPHEALREAVA